jgi:hypothetical protein
MRRVVVVGCIMRMLTVRMFNFSPHRQSKALLKQFQKQVTRKKEMQRKIVACDKGTYEEGPPKEEGDKWKFLDKFTKAEVDTFPAEKDARVKEQEKAEEEAWNMRFEKLEQQKQEERERKREAERKQAEKVKQKTTVEADTLLTALDRAAGVHGKTAWNSALEPGSLTSGVKVGLQMGLEKLKESRARLTEPPTEGRKDKARGVEHARDEKVEEPTKKKRKVDAE